MTTTVIYHRSDFDGEFCREIAKKAMPDAKLIGWDYGDPEPDVSREDALYILDLSVPGLMDHPRLIWIDHHKSAIEKYDPDISGYRIDGVAACRLAWQHFFVGPSDLSQPDWCGYPGKQAFIDRMVKEPLAVRLAGEYDIFDKRDPNAELFQHGLRSRELTENLWDCLLVNQERDSITGMEDIGTVVVLALLERGGAVQYAKTRENAIAIKNNGFTVKWHGLTFLCCNAQQYNSHLFTAGIKPEHDALLGFCLRANGKWTVSLYGVPGKPDIDLAQIAVLYGGGGHKQACGFTCNTLPFLDQKSS